MDLWLGAVALFLWTLSDSCTNAGVIVGPGFTDLNFTADVFIDQQGNEYDWLVPLTFSDVDEDGFIDVAFLLRENPAMVAWRRNVDGSGNFAAATGTDTGDNNLTALGENVLLNTTGIQNSPYSHVVFADFNGDSIDDLLVVNYQATGYLRGDSVGNYTEEPALRIFSESFRREVLPFRLDDDGGVGLLENTFGSYEYYSNPDNTGFQSRSDQLAPFNSESLNIVEFDAADGLDLLYTRSYPESSGIDLVQWVNRSSLDSQGTLLKVSPDFSSILMLKVGDFDNDSDLDFVVWLRKNTNFGGVRSVVLFENIDNTFALNRSLVVHQFTDNCCSDCGCPDAKPRIIASDINNDGALDLLIYDSITPNVTMYLNTDPSAGIHNTSNMFSAANSSGVWSSDDTSHRFVDMRVEDVNHDGYGDLLVWMVGSNDDMVVTLMHNDFAPPTPMPTAPPTAAPSPSPTSSPTDVPTPTPTVAPSPQPTDSPTPSPTPAPVGLCSPLSIAMTIPDESVADSSCDGTRWNERCALRCANGTANVGGLGVFYCKEDSTWFPDPATDLAIQCSDLCPEFPAPPADNGLRAPCVASQPGRSCGLQCADGLVPNISSLQEALPSELRCGADSRWYTREAFNSSVPQLVATAGEVLQCVEPLCRISPGVTVEGIVCVLNRNINVYESTVPYAENYNVTFKVGDVEEVQRIKPGPNEFTYEVNSTSSTVFNIFMEDPSTEHYLENLYVYNFTLEEEFQLASSIYSARSLRWMPEVSLDAVPVQHATVRAYTGASRAERVEVLADDPRRPERFAFRVVESTDLTLVVTGQNGMQREYVLEVVVESAKDCGEQLACEASGYDGDACGEFCETEFELEEDNLSVDWRATAVLGGVCFLLWLLTTLFLKRLFSDFPWLSPPVCAMWASVFDGVNDMLFLVLMYTGGFLTETYILLGLFGGSICASALILLYSIKREQRKHPQYVAWQIDRSAIAALVGFLSLFNCEVFTVLGVGRDLTPRKPMQAQQPGAQKMSGRERLVNYFMAPMSESFGLKLHLGAWVPLVLDDVGFSCVQIYLIVLRNSEISSFVFVFLALNVFLLIGRFVMVSCRSITLSSHRTHIKNNTMTFNVDGAPRGQGKGNAIAVYPGVEMAELSANSANSDIVSRVNTNFLATMLDVPIRDSDGNTIVFVDRRSAAASRFSSAQNSPSVTATSSAEPSVAGKGDDRDDGKESAASREAGEENRQLKPAVYTHLVEVFERAQNEASSRRPSSSRDHSVAAAGDSVAAGDSDTVSENASVIDNRRGDGAPSGNVLAVPGADRSRNASVSASLTVDAGMPNA